MLGDEAWKRRREDVRDRVVDATGNVGERGGRQLRGAESRVFVGRRCVVVRCRSVRDAGMITEKERRGERGGNAISGRIELKIYSCAG